MRIPAGILLISGIIGLYSGMGCLHVPVTVSMPGLPEQPPIVRVNVESSPVLPESGQIFTGQLAGAKPVDPFLDFIRRLEAGLPAGVAQPQFTRGIYLANGNSRNKAKLERFIAQAGKTGLNTFVMDVQPRMVPREHVALVKQAGIFPIARVVVYEGGLKQAKSDSGHIAKICQLIEDAGYQGFGEVQLDYIRYADEPALQRLPLREKYAEISSILERAKAAADRAGVLLSADLFGRVTLNENDHIGQKLENFARYVQTIYPMVYPSHYYGDEFRMSNPYETVKEGVAKSKDRIPQTRIVAYIQGFTMLIQKSGLNLEDYVAAQIRAVQDARGDGFVIWNPRNEYAASFAALLRPETKSQLVKSK